MTSTRHHNWHRHGKQSFAPRPRQRPPFRRRRQRQDHRQQRQIVHQLGREPGRPAFEIARGGYLARSEPADHTGGGRGGARHQHQGNQALRAVQRPVFRLQRPKQQREGQCTHEVAGGEQNAHAQAVANHQRRGQVPEGGPDEHRNRAQSPRAHQHSGQQRVCRPEHSQKATGSGQAASDRREENQRGDDENIAGRKSKQTAAAIAVSGRGSEVHRGPLRVRPTLDIAPDT